MCRISGILDRASGQVVADTISMRDAMRHGGPDNAGIYYDESASIAFGHRRLSIIDLSDAGNQPMLDDSEQVVLTFNGEIYNYVSLRDELKSLGFHFKTQSDSEVIINSYLCWEERCFSKFKGMFAIAIYDKRRGKLILARDHAGIKPLYYYADDSCLYFASEIRGFKALGNKWQENDAWKILFLTYGYIPEPSTTLKEVYSLEKGSCKIFDIRTLQAQQIFFYKDNYLENINDPEEAKLLLRSTLQSAVERHLVADAPIGLFLSGGIDSSILTILSKKYKKDNLFTLSIDFDDKNFSEQYYQDIIVKKVQPIHHSFVLNKVTFIEDFPDILQAMDQPSADGINTYFICKYAKQFGLKAVLSGLGADELLGGYPSFKKVNLIKRLKSVPDYLFSVGNLPLKDKYKKLSFLKRKDPVGEYLFYRGYFNSRETARLLDCDIKEVNHVLSAVTVPKEISKLSDGNRVSYLESNFYMQGQLLKDTDVMSMWHSLEVRVPFLDIDLIKAIHSISSEIKFGNKQSKYLLIESFKDILPSEIWNRKKQGFLLPFKNWMSEEEVQRQLQVNNKSIRNRFRSGKLEWSRYWAYAVSEEFSVGGRPPLSVKKILFLNLTTFSHIGGIEKFNKCFLKALSELQDAGYIRSKSISSYDSETDNKYYPSKDYKGFKGRRSLFVIFSVLQARKYDKIVIGHINMGIVAFLIKLLYPAKKLIIITHGIEVWGKLSGFRKRALELSDVIITVSNFTKKQLVEIQKVDADRIRVFPNTIDPYFEIPNSFHKNSDLRKRYDLGMDSFVLFTLARISSSEKYKGYDIVLECLPVLLKDFPGMKYILGGKYDVTEGNRINNIIRKYSLENNVKLLGYIDENELIEHYKMSDMFIMPSKKEGFGIVFIEAIVSGLPVIAGNHDGSTDALANGELGTLVNPESKDEIISAIRQNVLKEELTEVQKRELQQKALYYFGFDKFKNRLKNILVDE